jgi:hypothetical protein
MSNSGVKTILFLTADPTDATRLRSQQELREVREKLQLARLRDAFSLEPRTSVRPGDISQGLLDVRPKIVHFSGHGTGAGELCVEDASGRTCTILPEVLASLFARFVDDVNCVILNSCYSEIQARAIARHIKHVIGTTRGISDRAAITFAVGFYKGLGAGCSVDEAYKFGLVEMAMEGHENHGAYILVQQNELGTSGEYCASENSSSTCLVEPLTSERPDFRYSNLFQISSLRLPYVVVFGGWEKDANEYRQAEIKCLRDADSTFQLPSDFEVNRPQYTARLWDTEDLEPKCRLLRHDCQIVPGDRPNLLTFGFGRVRYIDYLLSGEHLDDPLPNDTRRSFRDKYAPTLDFEDLAKWRLTNICGVGVFVLTRDNRVIVSKHSRNVSVYGGIRSYSASGTMDWERSVDPFVEVARECEEEIGHRLNLDDTYLIGFGLDSKKLYFQFSFLEWTGLSSQEVLMKAIGARDYKAEMEELAAVPLELGILAGLVKSQAWEPAAAAALLTICAKQFGLNKVEAAIDPAYVRKRDRDEMVAEWERRALRPGEQAVMSARYPFHRYSEESRQYVDAVMDFLGDDVDGKDVLEVGAGTGRITERLVRRVGRLTCLDISGKMLERNRRRLGPLVERVEYIQVFAQDYRPNQRHDVVVCSLVLIHSVGEDQFREFCNRMSTCANTLFIFEHTDAAYQVSGHTQPRTEPQLVSAFPGYRVDRRTAYRLFSDNIIFLKLVH